LNFSYVSYSIFETALDFDFQFVASSVPFRPVPFRPVHKNYFSG
jgi:hypothetical protein